PSIPIVLATDYSPQALAHFLLDPLRYRPAGRMPSLHLGPQEAADLAQYLQREPHATVKQPGAGAEEIAKGREQVGHQRCSVCHSTGEEMPKRTSQPLVQLAPEKGCLAASQSPGIPHYDLSEPQRRTIQVALRAIRSGPPAMPSAAQRIDDQLTRLNCYACH